MISFLFDLISSLAHAFWDTLSFLLHAALQVFSAVASVVLWPIKTVAAAIGNWWGIPFSWTPVFLIGCGILLLLLVFLTVWAIAANRRNRS